MSDLLFHPAFQSVAFPAVLSVVGLGVLLRTGPAPGRHSAAAVAVLALMASLVLLPGWHWPAGSAVQKLPWIVAIALGLALAIEAMRGPAWAHWAATALAWGVATLWLAGTWAVTPATLLAVVAGAAVLACLTTPGVGPRAALGAPSDTRDAALLGTATAATLTIASLGLAGLAALGGSLLLAQLAAMVATVGGVLALFGWWVAVQHHAGSAPASRVLLPAPVALMPLGLAWLGIAQVASLSGVSAARLGLLGLAFALPLLLARLGARSVKSQAASAWSPVVAALLAAVPAIAAIAWQVMAPAGAGLGSPAGLDDPYYEPRWK